MGQGLKEGDTCLIIRCDTFPEYVGRAVELVCPIPPGQSIKIDESKGVCFQNAKDGPAAWIVHSHHDYQLKTYGGSVLFANYAAFAEYCLLKISDDPDNKEILADKVREEETC